MADEPNQMVFDWMDESYECVEGVKLDPAEEYVFELKEITSTVSSYGSNHEQYPGQLVLIKTAPKDLVAEYRAHPNRFEILHNGRWGKDYAKFKPYLIKNFQLKWILVDRNLSIRMDLPIFGGGEVRVNPAAPETESPIVMLSRKLGYNPVVNGKFAPGDFIKPGIMIKAHVAERKVKKKDGTEGTFHDIDVNTIELVSGEGSGQQQVPDDEVPAESAEEIRKIAKGSKNVADVIKKVKDAAKKDPSKMDLIQHVMTMSGRGDLKF